MINYLNDGVSFPSELSWKCSKCGRENASHGKVEILSIVKDGDAFKKCEEKDRDDPLIAVPWKYAASKIIKEPSKHFKWIRNYVHADDPECSVCKNREFWARSAWYRKYTGVALIMLLLGIAVAVLNSDARGWILFAIGAAYLAVSEILKRKEKDMIDNIPEGSYPTIKVSDEDYGEIMTP